MIETNEAPERLALLKLVSGEEVVAQLYRDPKSADAWMLHKPYTIVQIPVQQNGQMAFILSLQPFLRCLPPDAQENVSVDMIHIITMADVPPAMEKVYLQQRSGIDLSTSAASLVKTN